MDRVTALVDYDGWMRHERWDVPLKEAIRMARSMVSDRSSRVEMVQVFAGGQPVFHRRSWRKTNACRL